MLSSLRIAFVVLVSCLAALPAQGENAGEPKDPFFVEEFGTPGDPGSFRVRFCRNGGGMFSLQLMDHWQSVGTGSKSEHDSGDYMLLCYNGDNDGGDHALRVREIGGQPVFPQNLLVDRWADRKLPDGIEFTIRSSSELGPDGQPRGLELRRTLRHVPEERGFVLEFGLKNFDFATVGNSSITLELLGPWLVNPSHTTLVGNSSIAIAVPQSEDAEFRHLVPATGKVQQFEEIDLAALKFAGTTSRFFGAFLQPRNELAPRAISGLLVDTGPRQTDELTETKAGTMTRMRYRITLPIPAVGQETVASYGLYLGPKSYRVFETLPPVMQTTFEPVLDVDLAGGCCFEIPGARMMAKLLLTLLGWFFGVLGNWGFAIITLTVLVRGLLLPLNFRMQKSMRAYSSKMAVLKPKLDKLNEQYADDPKAKQQAMIAFQREHKMIPPIGGCLPILLTMPVYIGLFTALRTAYDLRQQPFLGWIQDLSLSDALFELPFWPGAFNLLPLIWMGMFIYLTTRQPLPTDPQQRSVQRMMRFMPLIMGVMLYGYASALLLYMVTSMVWSLGESALVKKILGPVDPNVASMTPTPM